MSFSEDFLAGWTAARVHAQNSGSVPPAPPEVASPSEKKAKAKAKPKAKKPKPKVEVEPPTELEDENG